MDQMLSFVKLKILCSYSNLSLSQDDQHFRSKTLQLFLSCLVLTSRKKLLLLREEYSLLLIGFKVHSRSVQSLSLFMEEVWWCLFTTDWPCVLQPLIMSRTFRAKLCRQIFGHPTTDGWTTLHGILTHYAVGRLDRSKLKIEFLAT